MVHPVEERADQRRRHHLADVVDAGQLLECDADDLALAEHRAAAVAGVDRRVDGHREQVALRVAVALDLDARHHALGDRQLLAADRVADDRDAVLEARERAKGDGPEAGPEGLVLDGEEGDVCSFPFNSVGVGE